MRIVVKLGGTLLDEEASRTRLSREIAAIAREHQVAVVHGGGKQMTRFLAERGVESQFVDGLRVTTPEVVDALLKVFAGSVNHQLVASLVAAGSRAVGLTGIDAGIAVAVPMDPRLGAVGKITGADASLLLYLTDGGYLPVVACVAGGANGEIYNVNADQMAVACAASFGAESLVFLTDVDGVRGADGATAPALTMDACEELICTGVATGGMQAKLNAAISALRQNVASVIIAPGGRPGTLSDVLEGTGIGTRVHA